MKYPSIKNVAFCTAVPDPAKDGSFRDQYQAAPGILSIEEDDRGYIILTALRHGIQPHPDRGVVRVPPSNVRGIRHHPAPVEQVKK